MVNTSAEEHKRIESVGFEIRVDSLLRLLALLAVAGPVFLAATGIVYGLLADARNLSSALDRPSVMLILSQFNPASDHSLANWYSSMAMLSVGIVAMILHLRNAPLSSTATKWGWLIVSVSFFALSFDALGSIRDAISRTLPLTGLREAILFVVLFLVTLTMAVFVWREVRLGSMAFWLMGTGLLLLLSLPAQEYFDVGMLRSNDDSWGRSLSWILVAEGTGILAPLLLIAGMVTHLLAGTTSARMAVVQFSISRALKSLPAKMLIAFSGAWFVLIVFGGFRTHAMSALNWFPASLAFVLFTVLFFRTARMLWILGYLLLFSGYYGSNFYTLIHWEDIAILSYAVRLGMLAGLTYFTYALSSVFRDSSWRFAHLSGGLLMGSGFVFDHPLVTIPVAIGLIIILRRHFARR